MTKTTTLDADIGYGNCPGAEMLNKMKKFKPTHVVTSITYGGDAHIIFQNVSMYSQNIPVQSFVLEREHWCKRIDINKEPA